MTDPTPDALLSIIGDVYECSLQPDNWSAVLTRITTMLNAAYTSLNLVDHKRIDSQFVPRLVVASPWDREMLRRLYAEFSPADVPGNVFGGDVDAPQSSIDQVGEPVFQASRFYQEWVKPQNLRDASLAKFIATPDRLGLLVCATSADREPVTADERRLLATLCPHLRRAVMISDVLDYSRVELDVFRTALDSIGTPIILVNAESEIAYINSRADALLRTDNILQSKAGMLTPANQAMAAAFADAIRRSTGSALDLGSRGIGIPVSTPGHPAAVAYVLPLAAAARGPASRAAVAAIFVSMSATGMPPQLDVLRTLFDLTPAESRVMLEIGMGKTIADTAVILNISENTAKTHLSRIFQKTSSNRQSDIMQLVTSLAAPVWEKPGD
jgi:DNA-binding CsgD family transcriptional regulator/PAS domain-containing protein